MTEILYQGSDFTKLFIYRKPLIESKLRRAFFKDTFHLLVDSILYKKFCTLTTQNGTKTKPNMHKHVSNVT